MMRIAWIAKYDDEEDWRFFDHDPRDDGYGYSQVRQIVYTEIDETPFS